MRVLFCEEHDKPLDEQGWCNLCGYHPDMQSTYIAEAKTVLIADDDEANRQFLADYFDRYNFRVVACSNGETALKQFQTYGEFDFVLTDYQMPRMNGIDLTDRILKIQPKQLIAMMTADGREASKRFKKLNRDVHIFQKPFRMREIEEFLREESVL